jgi:hypothetical protein
MSESVMPGAAIRAQRTSWPAASRAVTAALGKFSLARKRISGCAREYLLRAQGIARIGKTRDDVVVGHPRVIPEDIGLALHPSAISPIISAIGESPRCDGLSLGSPFSGRPPSCLVCGRVSLRPWSRRRRMGLKLTRSLDEGRSFSKPASQGAAGDGASKAGLGHGRYAQRCDALFHMLNDTMLCEELVLARKANPLASA